MKNALNSAFFNQNLRYFGMEEKWKIFQKIRMNTVNIFSDDSKTGSEAAHFSFRYTNPAVFDIIKKLSSTHFRRKTIHPETEIILLLKSI